MPLSAEAVRRIDDLRAELLQRNGEHGTEFWFTFTEAQMIDLASGYVPNDLKAAFRAALDWDEEDRRRVERPVPPSKRRQRTA